MTDAQPPPAVPAPPGALGGRPVAWHLVVLCAALLLPMLALEAFLLLQVAGAERARHEAAAREAARRITVSLDRELTGLQAVLEVLASSDHLQARDLAAFHRRAVAVRRPPGAQIALRTPDGRALATTGAPWGAPPPAPEDDPRDPDTDAAAAATSLTRISDLLAGRSGPRFSLVAAVPEAGGGGRAAYLLSLDVPASALDGLLREADVPARMTATLLDRRGTILARTAEAARFVGRRIPLSAPSLDPTRREGWERTRDAEGRPIALAFARSEVAGWTGVVFLPEAEFAAPLRRSLWAAAALGALLVALAAALAYVFAHRIARPIAALAGLAARSGAGPVAPLATPVREVNEVGHALAAAWAETRAREGEREELLLTLDQAQVLVRDPQGRITLWTAGKERLYGWTRAEALGRLSHELLGTEFPRPLPEIEAELRVRGGWQGELRQRRRDGVPVVVISQWALRRGPGGEPVAVVEACNDVTALRGTEGELRRSRDLLASVLDGSADPIFAKDMEGRFAILNRPAAALLGVPPGQALGRRPDEFLPAGSAAALGTADREVMATGRTRVTEDEVATPDGGRRVLLTTRAPWRDAGGRIIGVVGVSRDISDRRRAEARLREAEMELLHVSRLSDMGAMAAALAHELNQPLTAVANFANAARRLLAPGGAPPDAERLEAAHEAMAEAAEQAVHAGAIVRRLRDFVGRGEGDKRVADLNALVGEAASLALAGARDAGIEARLDLDPAAPRVLADKVQLQQVVVNLVRNAVEAMRDAPRRELEVATAALDGGSAVEVRVADTGPGLAPEVAGRLFEPFVTTKRQGMGVGLSICRTIVEDHGGRLATAPRPGGGTVFRFVLPALSVPPPGGEEGTDAG